MEEKCKNTRACFYHRQIARPQPPPPSHVFIGFFQPLRTRQRSLWDTRWLKLMTVSQPRFAIDLIVVELAGVFYDDCFWWGVHRLCMFILAFGGTTAQSLARSFHSSTTSTCIACIASFTIKFHIFLHSQSKKFYRLDPCFGLRSKVKYSPDNFTAQTEKWSPNYSQFSVSTYNYAFVTSEKQSLNFPPKMHSYLHSQLS